MDVSSILFFKELMLQDSSNFKSYGEDLSEMRPTQSLLVGPRHLSFRLIWGENIRNGWAVSVAFSEYQLECCCYPPNIFFIRTKFKYLESFISNRAVIPVPKVEQF